MKVIKENVLDNPFAVRNALIEHKGKFYVVSQVDGIFASETMIFEADQEGNITDWSGVYQNKFADFDRACKEFFNNAISS